MQASLPWTVTHRLDQLSHTNAGNIVPVCSCGWVGSVHIAYRNTDGLIHRGELVWSEAEQNAKLEHLRHARG
jgi:hypothetical protein